MSSKIRIGLIGARGYVGSELIRLLSAHPQFELGFVSSRERVGQRVCDFESGVDPALNYVNFGPEAAVAARADALVLALPNGKAHEFVAAVDSAGLDPALLDLSADYRFDARWYYGLPELTRVRAPGERRISNPGCYASAMQLAIAPLCGRILGPVQCFGVSGYSGAGTSPSDKNNVELLRDNLMPYSLSGHIHEREVSIQLAEDIEFMPHVAAHFRGITMTVNLHLEAPTSVAELVELYRARYAGEPLIRVTDTAPWVSRIAGKTGVEIGGFTVSADGRRVVIVSTLDNLMKGAASQALQNLNLAFGLDEFAGLNAQERLP
ncbi:N-acetyl-gamma-glutamyl-phosphate reductase [Aquimonas sp.]|jgi:N-acetyl-gamma-glutamyl-phosphate reductase|uniref:N-acetyl-gamma-glutamyl-phosphate reductase n=1 Tax=Aquimonas sp. TaxID=1872588 RepID=UPI0037C0C1EB